MVGYPYLCRLAACMFASVCEFVCVCVFVCGRQGSRLENGLDIFIKYELQLDWDIRLDRHQTFLLT
jgi:hypothetical protein